MFISIIVSLLVGLLGTFLNHEFKKWMEGASASRLYGGPLSGRLEIAKPEFMAQVKRKFWYGSKRLAIAENLYDKAVARYHSDDPKYLLDTSTDAETAFKKLAEDLVAGLQPDADALQ